MKIIKIIEYSLIFVIVVMIVNLPILNGLILNTIDRNHFKYANNNASFTYKESFEFKDGNINNRLINSFAEDAKPTQSNSEVYRLYRLNPLCFWRWSYYYFTSSQFKYKDWDDIVPNRVHFEKNSRWQDF